MGKVTRFESAPRAKSRGVGSIKKTTGEVKENRMSKTIEFTYDDKDYVLEFTRRTVEQMERQGFVASDVRDKPMLTLPALWAGAFLAHHRGLKPSVIKEIYDLCENKQELIGKLSEMYNEPIMALIEEPEKSEGNVIWKANW